MSAASISPIPSVSQLPSTGLLGLPLLKFIEKDPLAAASAFHTHYGDVAKLNILFRRIYYFFHPDATRQILVEHDADFAREQRLLKIFQSMQGRNALTSEGADWARQRRILTPGFSQKRVTGYMALMQQAARDCLDRELPNEVGQSSLVDVGELTTQIAMDVILRTLFSKAANPKLAAQMSRATRVLTRQTMREVYWALIPPDWLPFPGRGSKLKAKAEINRMIAEHIADRCKQTNDSAADKRSDVLAMLLSASDDAASATDAAKTRLSPQEVHDNALLLFGAGFDTTASALCFWIGLMAAHPDVVRKLRSELDALCANLDASNPTRELQPEDIARLPYLNATIKEAMRLYPPSTALISRVALKDVVIQDTPIPKGTLIAIPIWQLHHDPRWFPEPEKFCPERFLPDAPTIPRGAFMPFGAGPHFCLGQHFASIEMALIAAEIIEHFDVVFEPGAGMPEVTVDLALKPKTAMWVRFVRR
jgi:cytochrome P450